MSQILTLVSPDAAAVREAVRRLDAKADWLGEAAADVAKRFPHADITVRS